jgi:transposase
MSGSVKKVYTEEFKQEAVRLAERGEKSIAQLAKDLGISKHTLFLWKSQRRTHAADGALGLQGTGVHRLTPEQDEIRRLKRELAVVTEEREILKKAMAFFAKESK